MVKELRMPTHRAPATPGEMLVAEFLTPLGLTIAAFAEHVGMRRGVVREIVAGRRGVNAEEALRFGRALRTSAVFWLNVQRMSDAYAAQHAVDEASIRKIKPLFGAA